MDNLNFNNILNNIFQNIKNEIKEVANEIKEESLKQVPEDTGNLRNSLEFKVDEDINNINIEISYNTDYALKTHEYPLGFRKSGAKNKYLEDPFLEKINDLDTRIEGVINNVDIK